MEQTNPFLNFIPPQYIDALLKLHKVLEGINTDWALSGDIGEALEAVRVEPDCIEIATSRDGAKQIHLAVEEFCPNQLEHLIQRLPRDALIKGKEYPVYIRSYNFDFYIDSIKVIVYGDMQFKINDWAWGDTLEFDPVTVYVVDRKTFLVPLSVKYKIYQQLGWNDRAEKINWLISNQQRLLRRRF